MTLKPDFNRSRRIIVLQHAESENLGTIEEALQSADLEFEYVRTFEGQAVPTGPHTHSGLIVMGGPMGVYETDRFPFLLKEVRLIETFLAAQKPVLGVCLGSQLIATALGAKVRKGRQKEIGWYPVALSPASKQDPLWRKEPSRFVSFHWHGDTFDLPSGAVSLAGSELTPVQAYRYGERAYGFLFHLEITINHIRKMLNEFAAEVEQEDLSAAQIVKEAESFLPQLQEIGTAVFGRWGELI